jgi:hypothetical protein
MGRKQTPETRAKISAAKKGRKRPDMLGNKYGTALKGRKRPPFSAETRAKMSAWQTGLKRPPRSPETRAKIGAANCQYQRRIACSYRPSSS